MSHVQHDGANSVFGSAIQGAPVPMSMISAVPAHPPEAGFLRRLAKPIAMAAFGLCYGLLFASVVILPIVAVIFGLVVLFG
jgi:hypothetical protein